MTTENVFKEVLKSPELQLFLNIPVKDIENITLHEKSQYSIIQIIKEIFPQFLIEIIKSNGQKNHKSKEQIFQIIQKQIIQL